MPSEQVPPRRQAAELAPYSARPTPIYCTHAANAYGRRRSVSVTARAVHPERGPRIRLRLSRIPSLDATFGARERQLERPAFTLFRMNALS